ncbi:MAG: methyltransferase domain-containing protein [Desulfofustis sp.]|nr:methyltransferase domain-containing protein [Desulfofustis sp.]
METYQWDSRDYELHSGGQQLWARELIEKLVLTGTEELLDIGCGDGKVTAEIAGLLSGGRVLGIDNSESMIELATTRYPPEDHPNLSFTLLDAVDVSFAPTFDVVFSNAALHWVKDHRPVVESVHACLKPGGRMLLQMGGQGNAQTIIGVLATIMQLPRYRRYFEGFEFPYGFHGVDYYQELLREAGFVDPRVELIDKDMTHDGIEGLKGWIRTTWLPYTERLDEPDKDMFIEELAESYLKIQPLDAQGKAHVAMVRLEVEARKPR